MSEHALLTVLSVLVTIACCLLTALLLSLRLWKKEIGGKIDKVETGFKEKLKEICDANTQEHEELWARCNHHWHNGGGNVVIPTPGAVKGG